MRLVGVVLAGGRSRRMGRSKALLPIDGRRLIDRTIEVVGDLRPLIDRVVVSGTIPDLETIADLEPFAGPVAGIASVATSLLRESKPVDGLVVVPVDLPRLTSQSLRPLVEYFLVNPTKAAFYEGFWLPAVFALNEALVDHCQSHPSMHGLLTSLGARSMPPTEWIALTNANTPTEWATITRRNP